MKKKKNSGGLALLIILTGVVLLGGFLYYTFAVHKTNPKYFTSEKEKVAEKLYTEVASWDFESDYPKTPQEIMRRYNIITYLIYGNILLDNQLLETLLVQQRQMHSKEINEMTSYETQYSQLEAGLEKFRKASSAYLEVTQDDAIPDPDGQYKYIIKTTIYTNNLGTIYMNYYFDQPDPDRRWKITSRLLVDQNGNPLL